MEVPMGPCSWLKNFGKPGKLRDNMYQAGLLKVRFDLLDLFRQAESWSLGVRVSWMYLESAQDLTGARLIEGVVEVCRPGWCRICNRVQQLARQGSCIRHLHLASSEVWPLSACYRYTMWCKQGGSAPCGLVLGSRCDVSRPNHLDMSTELRGPNELKQKQLLIIHFCFAMPRNFHKIGIESFINTCRDFRIQMQIWVHKGPEYEECMGNTGKNVFRFAFEWENPFLWKSLFMELSEWFVFSGLRCWRVPLGLRRKNGRCLEVANLQWSRALRKIHPAPPKKGLIPAGLKNFLLFLLWPPHSLLPRAGWLLNFVNHDSGALPPRAGDRRMNSINDLESSDN